MSHQGPEHTSRQCRNRKQRVRKRLLQWPRPRRLQYESLEKRLMLDGTGPAILASAPDEVRNDVFDHIDVEFSEPIDLSTFTPEDVTVTGPLGDVSPTSVTHIDGNTYRIDFPALTVRGNYNTVIGPDIADLDGDLMD